MSTFDTKLNSGVSPPFGSPGGRAVLNAVVRRNKMKKLGTWNVRSLYTFGKVDCVLKEMDRMKLDILGVSEMRWIGN